MKKQLTSLKNAFHFSLVLHKYNRRYKRKVQEQHIRVLLVVQTSSHFPVNRHKIISVLKKSLFSTNYTQLKIVLDYLLEHDLIWESSRNGRRAFNITPSGIYLLESIEKSIRTIRFDGAKS